MIYIFIEKLFGEHDIKIRLDRKLNIMIGENGIGKTTILNVIHNLYSLDFIGLTKYKFKKIVLSKENENIEILQSDLYPEINSIVKKLKKSQIYYINNNNDYKIINSYEFMIEDLKKIKDKNKDILYEFLNSLYHNRPLSKKIKTHVPSSLYEQYNPFINPAHELKEILKSKAYFSKEHYTFSSKGHYNYFKSSKVEEFIEKNNGFINGIRNFFNKQILYLNMVNQYEISDKKVKEPIIFSNMIRWLNQYEEIGYNIKFQKGNRPHFLEKIVYGGGLDYRIGIDTSGPKKYIDDYMSLFKKGYEDVQYNLFNKDKSLNQIVNNLIEKESIDINAIINRFFFSEDYMKEINNKAISYYIDIIGESYNGNPYEDDENIYVYDIFNNEEREKIESYLKPLILEESIFGEVIYCALEPIFKYSGTMPYKLVNAFRKFYDENIDDIINAINPRLKNLENLLNEFITSKVFIITPSGLKIFIKKYKEYESGKFKVYTSEEDELRITDLSSGEKKLLIILLFSCVFENILFLIDEPELSFSITWQERLIETVTNQENENSFLIATHSPLIISNEEIAQSVLPLPLEEGI